MVNTLVHSILCLRDVMVLAFFMLTVFALVGLQLYKGGLRGKCVYNPPNNISKTAYNNFINDNRINSSS